MLQTGLGTGARVSTGPGLVAAAEAGGRPRAAARSEDV